MGPLGSTRAQNGFEHLPNWHAYPKKRVASIHRAAESSSSRKLGGLGHKKRAGLISNSPALSCLGSLHRCWGRQTQASVQDRRHERSPRLVIQAEAHQAQRLTDAQTLLQTPAQHLAVACRQQKTRSREGWGRADEGL